MSRAHVRVLPVCGACPSPLRFPPVARLAWQDGSTPLIMASSEGHHEVVDRLIAARATVDAADKVVPRTRHAASHYCLFAPWAIDAGRFWLLSRRGYDY